MYHSYKTNLYHEITLSIAIRSASNIPVIGCPKKTPVVFRVFRGKLLDPSEAVLANELMVRRAWCLPQA